MAVVSIDSERFGYRIFRSAKAVFWIAFLAAFILQSVHWYFGFIADVPLWGMQAKAIVTDNPDTFPLLDAYGHPGGPVLESTYLVHLLAGTGYVVSVAFAIIPIQSFLIATIAMLAARLRPRWTLWPFIIIVPLALNPISDISTPTSTLSALLTVLLFFLTWYVIEKDEPFDAGFAVKWSVIAGAIVATRIDAGVAAVIFSAPFLMRFGLRSVLQLSALALAVFWALDPFLWFDPLGHVTFLLENVFEHHSYVVYRTPGYVGYGYTGFFQASFALVLAPITLIYSFVCPPERRLFPMSILYSLCAFSIIVFVGAISAQLFAVRYLQSVIYIWEVLTPFVLLELLIQSRTPSLRIKLVNVLVALLVVTYPITHLFISFHFG